MPTWSKDDLKRAQRRNPDLQVVGSGKDSKLECPAGDGAVGPVRREEANPERVLVRFISVRKRLLDPDNLSEKWMLDCLRFSRIIPGDEPEKIELQTTQRKCAKGEEEHTVIELYALNTTATSLSKEDK